MTVYKSCEWIENGIDFDVGMYGSNIMMCCYVSSIGGGNIMLKTDYNGETIDWDEFWRIKNSYREILKSGQTIDKCKDCVYLQTKDWPEENHIRSVIFDHFTACNCDCEYCYTHENKEKYNSIKSYNVLNIVKDMHERGILQRGQIGFGGGEPTILPEFDDLLNYLLDNGYDNINVPTSGIRYSPVLERGVSEGKVRVLCSLDCGCRETFKRIKNIDAFDKVIENLKRYTKAQKYYENVNSKYIICPGINDNIEEGQKWMSICKTIGIDALTISMETIWMRTHRYNDDISEIYKFVKFMLENGKALFKYCIPENNVLQFIKAVETNHF